MNCADVRERLAALLYGDLAPAETGPLQEHLAGCAVCRREHAALEQLRQLLDAVPPPVRADVAVDLPRLYRAAAEQQARRQLPWRRVAFAACAAAAALLAFVLLPRLEMHLDGQQLTLRWGTIPPEAPSTPPAIAPPGAEVARASAWSAETDKRLKIVEELVQIVASDVDQRDQRQRQTLARIQARLQQMQSPTRRSATGPDARAVSLNQSSNGEIP